MGRWTGTKAWYAGGAATVIVAPSRRLRLPGGRPLRHPMADQPLVRDDVAEVGVGQSQARYALAAV